MTTLSPLAFNRSFEDADGHRPMTPHNNKEYVTLPMTVTEFCETWCLCTPWAKKKRLLGQKEAQKHTTAGIR